MIIDCDKQYKINMQDSTINDDESGLLYIQCSEKYFLGKRHEGRKSTIYDSGRAFV